LGGGEKIHVHQKVLRGRLTCFEGGSEAKGGARREGGEKKKVKCKGGFQKALRLVPPLRTTPGDEQEKKKNEIWKKRKTNEKREGNGAKSSSIVGGWES